MFSIFLPRLNAHLFRRVDPHPQSRPPKMNVSNGAYEPRVKARHPMTPFAPRDLDHGVVEAYIPFLNITFHQHHFSFRVCRNQFLRKRYG